MVIFKDFSFNFSPSSKNLLSLADAAWSSMQSSKLLYLAMSLNFGSLKWVNMRIMIGSKEWKSISSLLHFLMIFGNLESIVSTVWYAVTLSLIWMVYFYSKKLWSMSFRCLWLRLSKVSNRWGVSRKLKISFCRLVGIFFASPVGICYIWFGGWGLG